MSAVTTVDDARDYARQLVEREACGPGDLENAMRRLEQKYGISVNDLWRLRYRPPKRVWADVYLRLKLAVEAQRNAQIRKLQHEIAITEALAGHSDRAVVAAAAVVGAGSCTLPDSPRAPVSHESGGTSETG